MDVSGYSQEMVEKMERLCDILESIGKSDFVSKRLSLYGGTALNFIYLDIPRLSEDLDFNYRHIDEKDWGEVRDRIDDDLKWIIRSLGYGSGDLKINAKHNHCRFHLNYVSSQGVKGDIKIEIGYMRRFPDMEKDTTECFSHLTKGTTIKTMTPNKEELFANKFATMISRSRAYLNLRDVFDVHSIASQDFDQRLFLEIVALETIMMDMSYSTLLQVKERLKKERLSGRLEHLIRGDIDMEKIHSMVISFSERIVEDLSSNALDTVIDEFYSTGVLELDKFSFKKEMHPHISDHPQLRWLREKKGV